MSDARTALRSDVRTDLDAVIILAGRLLILPCTCTNMLSQARVYVYVLMCSKSCMWGNVGVAQSHATPMEAPYITWLHGPIKLCLFFYQCTIIGSHTLLPALAALQASTELN